jgi:hypothetical protein
MNQCDKCGAILGRDELVCKNCGNPVNNQGFTSGYNNNYYPGASLKSMVENTGTFNQPQDNYNNMGNNMFIGNMGGQNNSNNKNSGKKFNLKELGDKKIVIIALIGLLVVALIFIIFGNKIFGSSGDPVDTGDTFELKTPTITNPPIDPEPNPNPNPNPNPTPPDPEPTPPDPEPTPPEPEPEPEPQPSNFVEVSFENYSFEIPLDYNGAIYEKEGRKILYVTSKSGNWGGAINIEKGSYNQVVKSKENIKNNYESQGYSVNTIREQKVGSLTFFVLEIYDDEFGNGIAAFTSAGTNQVFFITVYTDDGKVDYNALGILSNLIYRAKLKAQGY